MKKFARLEMSGEKLVCAEIIETDTIVGKYHPSLVFVEIIQENKNDVQYGWEYNSGIFTEPVVEGE